MATVNFSVPSDVKEAFDKAFRRQNKSAVLTELRGSRWTNGGGSGGQRPLRSYWLCGIGRGVIVVS